MVKKILIAEDELIVAHSLKRNIEEKGYSVCDIVKTGKDAVRLALEKQPDLLIVDIFLEDETDGIDAVKNIHEKKFIPVIYTTASSDRLTYAKARETEMLKYLTKPYDIGELFEVIKSI